MAPHEPAPVHDVELSAGTVRYRDSGDGPPLLFVHGLLTDGTLWRKVVPLLEDRFRCIAPDWPLGSHRIPMRAGADLSPRGIARLVVELVEALGLEAPTLVANDTGGAVAQIAVADRPDAFGRLVLTPSDSFDNFLPPLFRPLQYVAKVPGALTLALQPLRLRPPRRLPIAFGGLSKRPVPDVIVDAWLEPFFAERGVRRDAARFLAAIDSRDTVAAAEGLRAFEGPALLAWAPEVEIFPMEHARRLAELLPDARIEEIADSYVYVPEDQPERLAELIGEFVAGTSARTSDQEVTG